MSTFALAIKLILSASMLKHFKILHPFLIKSFRDWRNQTDVSVTLGEVNCKNNDTDISDCDSRIFRHNCKYRDSIWLRCFSNTG